MLALEIEKQLAAEAKKRQRLNNANRIILSESEKGRARDKAAEMLGINPHYITDAKQIAKDAVLGLSLLLWGKLRLPSCDEDARHERQQLFRRREVLGLSRIEMLHPALPLPVLHLCVRMHLHYERTFSGQGRLIFGHV